MNIDAVLMAKSTMWGKFCTAGIDIHSGMWVRFVGYGDGDPLDDSQMMFLNDGGSCEPLDVARVRVAKRVPGKNHTEDCMIERDGWLRLGRMTIQDVLKIHDEEEYRYIYGNGREYLTEEEMQQKRFRYSLILVRAENLTLRIKQSFEGQKRVRAEFVHHGRPYQDIRVTDTEYEPENVRDGQRIGTAFLVMSMPVKPFKGRYYKLIAKIFPLRCF